jgi:hypothetical protein
MRRNSNTKRVSHNSTRIGQGTIQFTAREFVLQHRDMQISWLYITFPSIFSIQLYYFLAAILHFANGNATPFVSISSSHPPSQRHYQVARTFQPLRSRHNKQQHAHRTQRHAYRRHRIIPVLQSDTCPAHRRTRFFAVVGYALRHFHNELGCLVVDS